MSYSTLIRFISKNNSIKKLICDEVRNFVYDKSSNAIRDKLKEIFEDDGCSQELNNYDEAIRKIKYESKLPFRIENCERQRPLIFAASINDQVLGFHRSINKIQRMMYKST